MRARTKFYPTESINQEHLSATSELVRKHNLRPEDIESNCSNSNRAVVRLILACWIP
jgi:hypothetical protein